MSRILIVEYGEQGSARDLADQISKRWPDHHVEATHPSNVAAMLSREPWELLVVDAQVSEDQAVRDTKRLALTIPVVFATSISLWCRDVPARNNCPFRPKCETIGCQRPDIEAGPACRLDVLYDSWVFAPRRHAIEAVHMALSPKYREALPG